MGWIFCDAKKWSIQISIIVFLSSITDEAVVPPPWANPKLNPCATQPGGWQLLFWPPDGKCYKIFQIGYPCPEDMELSPAAIKSGAIEKFSAECRCPPKTAQSARDGRCYQLYSLGPCDKGSYFAPDKQYNSNSKSNRQWGICIQMKQCLNPNQIYWPQDGKCYQRLTKGPCPRGQLLTLSPDKLAACKCEKDREMREYLYRDGNCYQHFTKGPCREKGHLFLPDRNCGCYGFLPHYHEETQQCFEIGSIGPCNTGEHFYLDPLTGRGSCQCRPGYIRYQNATACHRPYTQGPCPSEHFLINATTCALQPCQRGHLYFPQHDRCYRVGTRGPCHRGRLVTFDFRTRPSLDGVSYNGVCSCGKDVHSTKCTLSDGSHSDDSLVECDKSNGMVRFGALCYKLYTQGPCPRGAWLAPTRTKRQELWTDETEEPKGMCECVPGYARTLRTYKGKNITECISPTVMLADYLNNNFSLQPQKIED